MKTASYLLLIGYAVAMGLGQILFKYVAVRTELRELPFLRKFLLLSVDPVFLASLLLYGGLTILWIWILGFIPLSRAYPYTFISIVVAGLGSYFLFDERLGAHFFIGTALIGAGLYVISRG